MRLPDETKPGKFQSNKHSSPEKCLSEIFRKTLYLGINVVF